MSEEEMQKKMEFIIEQQAQFAADIQLLRETQAADSKRITGLMDALTTVVGIIGKLSASQERTDARVAEVAASVNSLAGAQANLAEAQANTDERLNTLIGIIERYFSDGSDGKNQA
jgi:chromosome segregation ATPase